MDRQSGQGHRERCKDQREEEQAGCTLGVVTRGRPGRAEGRLDVAGLVAQGNRGTLEELDDERLALHQLAMQHGVLRIVKEDDPKAASLQLPVQSLRVATATLDSDSKLRPTLTRILKSGMGTDWSRLVGMSLVGALAGPLKEADR